MAIVTAPPAPPVVRIRRAPAIDPAFDDELPEPPLPSCPGQLAMPAEMWSSDPPAASAPPEPPEPPEPPVRRTRRAPAGEAQLAAHRFVEACAEVLNGYRPIAHLRPHTSPVDFATVVDHLTRRAVRVHLTPGGSAGGAAGGDPRAGRPRVAVRRVRICEPRAGVAEVAAVLDQRDGSWAMAVRLERRRERWTCTSLQVI
jgi:hypothetical protein